MPPFPSQMFQSESTNSSVAVFHLLPLPSRHRPSIPRANVAMFEKGMACEPTQWTPSGTKQNHETSQWAKNTAMWDVGPQRGFQNPGTMESTAQ